MSRSPDVLVVGGGAAGIMSAWRAASMGARVTILEKTPRIGTKILVSGGGKCNITHDGPVEEVLKGYRPTEARWLRPSFYRWPSQRVVEMFTEKGLEVYTRPNGRIFPVNQTAKEVVSILREHLEDVGVTIRLETAVKHLRHEGGQITGVETERGMIECRHLILSTGGSSYPNSGTTGDGWPWAKELGHTIVKVRAALAPIYLALDQEWIDALSGVALRNTLLKARRDGKEIDRWRGDLLFTHRGVSGPCALEVSRAIAEADGHHTLEVDLMPEKSPEQVAEWAQEHITKNPKKQIKSLIEGLVPESAVPWVFKSADVSPDSPCAQLDRKSRNRLLNGTKAWQLGAVRTVPLEKGECVAGGVSLDEVDPHSMRSAKCKGLYLCGEVLDVAGRVGGYNLQAAWATGYVAGESAAKDALG